ncbi:SAGA complex subunit spt20 [Leucoagaricus sp. SymC.cos]|nr:SAGA complex subunit spt20 [Leucoagaricus sp. SymC.cos]
MLAHILQQCILDDIRAHRIPVDFLDLFDAAKVPFYDGCMIVELLDYRPQRNKAVSQDKPERTRVVLHPNSETLWADICSLNQKHGGKWTDLDALEIESKILMATAPPLCLDPDPHLTRIANHVLRVTTPTVPNSLKRKAVALDPEDDEHEKLRRAKIMAFANPPRPKLHNPKYALLHYI